MEAHMRSQKAPLLISASATDAENSSQSLTCNWAWVSAAQSPAAHLWDQSCGLLVVAFSPSSPFVQQGQNHLRLSLSNGH